jgi:Cyclic nucleotide-binding domain/Glyoxalase/Bleomycin resistance protein/Dioxygenase superfamily
MSWRNRIDRRMREYRALPLFDGCSLAQLRQVSSAAMPLRLEAGTVLVRQGTPGRQFVFVREGTADVWRDGRRVDEIGPGGHFGEIALIRRIREPASIVARTAMTVDVIAKRDPIAKRDFAALYADLAPFRRCIDVELDRRLARWIPASDVPSLRVAAALRFLPSPPVPDPASLARFRCAGAQPIAVAPYSPRANQIGGPMTASPALDHVALTVPNLDDHVERLTAAFGMVVQLRSEHFAVLVDPASDFKLELSTSPDGEVHLRHLGFRADDVDAAHASLVAAGMETNAAPHRQDFARMYASFLQQPGGVEVQLVKYD